jgi:putative endonuclease
MTNQANGTLYTGVTNDLVRRANGHRAGAVSGFTKRYRLHRLIWSEWHGDIRLAIQREKNIKEWPRAWKTRLIIQANPDWRDLYPRLLCTVMPGRALGIHVFHAPVDVDAGPSPGTTIRAGSYDTGNHTNCLTSASRPVTAAAAAIAGETRCVRPPGPCRPSKLRFEVEAQR